MIVIKYKTYFKTQIFCRGYPATFAMSPVLAMQKMPCRDSPPQG